MSVWILLLKLLAWGYGIAKPMPAIDIFPWLTKWAKNPFLVDGSD
jgi:hypothetical protein